MYCGHTCSLVAVDVQATTQAKDLKPLPYPWPARMDPFHAFAAYPTQTLTEQTVLGLVDADVDTALRTLAYRQWSGW